jgi:hypothetical protein
MRTHHRTRPQSRPSFSFTNSPTRIDAG